MIKMLKYKIFLKILLKMFDIASSAYYNKNAIREEVLERVMVEGKW